MNNVELRDWYLGLSDSDKQIYLSLVSNQLTIHGRSIGLELTGVKQIEAFKGLNELQHQLSQHVAAIGSRRDRYPDEVLWNILNEKADWYGLLAHLNQSFDSARARGGWEDKAMGNNSTVHPLGDLLDGNLSACDFGVMEHGFAPHGRDYKFVIQDSLCKDPGTYELVFTHVVDLKYTTRVGDTSWRTS